MAKIVRDQRTRFELDEESAQVLIEYWDGEASKPDIDKVRKFTCQGLSLTLQAKLAQLQGDLNGKVAA